MLYGKKKGATAFTELIEIKDVPDTGSEPETIEVTTLKDTRKSYIMGRQDSPAQSFTYNYDEVKMHDKVMQYCDGDVHDFLVVFPDGSGYTIKGSASTYVKGYSANSAIEATLTIVAEVIEFKKKTEVDALLPSGE